MIGMSSVQIGHVRTVREIESVKFSLGFLISFYLHSCKTFRGNRQEIECFIFVMVIFFVETGEICFCDKDNDKLEN